MDDPLVFNHGLYQRQSFQRFELLTTDVVTLGSDILLLLNLLVDVFWIEAAREPCRVLGR